MGRSPSVLALDLASGGVSAALINPDISTFTPHEVPWAFDRTAEGSATLETEAVMHAVCAAIRASVASSPPPDALVLSSMMHTLVVSDDNGRARTPVFTWLDRRGEEQIEEFRQRFGPDFHSRTGTHYHPMFPVFKLAWLKSTAAELFAAPYRIASLKGHLLKQWTGRWADDIGTASASGLLNLATGEWDPRVLAGLEVPVGSLPTLYPSTDVVGEVDEAAATLLGIPPGLPVINGSGDGFLANIGSGCESDPHIAVSLGTTAAVRKFLNKPVVDESAGTFCYRFETDRFLLGCASNNGGNVLDWGRDLLGHLEFNPELRQSDVPLFIPFLHGERSPFWDSRLRERWVGLRADHSVGDRRRAIVEGLAFHLATYVELVEQSAGSEADAVVLSGNGFIFRDVARLLASVVAQTVLLPVHPGLATLRGAARCAFDALDISTSGAMRSLFAASSKIEPIDDPELRERFLRFKQAYFGV